MEVEEQPERLLFLQKQCLEMSDRPIKYSGTNASGLAQLIAVTQKTPSLEVGFLLNIG